MTDQSEGERADRLAGQCRNLATRVRDLEELINTPHTVNFLEAVKIEVAHQVERWGTVHDRCKQPAEWFWLIGFLAGKALAAAIEGNRSKALHHTISSAAVLANWHAAITGADNRFEPGSQKANSDAVGRS